VSRDVNHGPLWSTGVKSLVFTVVTVVLTGILASTISNSSAGAEETYTAIFNDATSLNRGDDVRMVGVKVGTIKDVSVTGNRLAKVHFTIRKGVRIDDGTVLQIRFRNLVGQRYLAVEQPSLSGPDAGKVPEDADQPTTSANEAGLPGTATTASTSGTETAEAVDALSAIKPGHTFGLEETRPALDLTVLFNGFRPLLQLLDPDDINKLSSQIVAVFQGEDATVDGLLQSTASLTSTLASKDQVIGELITSLSSVMTTINGRSGQLDTTLVTMERLVSGLAEDRGAIGDSIAGMGALTTKVGNLLGDTRPALRNSIRDLGVLSANLDKHSAKVDSFLKLLPTKLDQIGRLGSYGSWLNFYMCSMKGRIPMPEGYMGDLGVNPVAGRCR
jgi:phospholipid/cholesterol/gamma-HCH transport system substrate-binding protein